MVFLGQDFGVIDKSLRLLNPREDFAFDDREALPYGQLKFATNSNKMTVPSGLFGP